MTQLQKSKSGGKSTANLTREVIKGLRTIREICIFMQDQYMDLSGKLYWKKRAERIEIAIENLKNPL